MMENIAKERICLGAIVGVHGIKGEVKVKSWTSSDVNLGAYGALQNEDGSCKFSVKITGHSKDLLRCKIKGVDDRNAAEALIGTKLYVDRVVLPELSEEEYYQADLVGLPVIDLSSGKQAGVVTGIYNFGAGDILEIKLSSTGKSEMLPFTKQYVPEISINKGYIGVTSLLMNFAADDEENNEG